MHELHPPQRKSVEVVVEDAETGTLLHDWKARSDGRELAREKGERFGRYRLFAAGALIVVEAPGYAPAFAGPGVVKLRRGVALRVTGEPPKDLAVYYNSPLGPNGWGIAIGPGSHKAGEELNLTELPWEGGRLLRDHDHLPPESRVDVVARNEAGVFLHQQIETGVPGTEVTVELAWPETRRHELVVQGEDGAVRAGVEVSVSDRRGRLGSVRTDAQGRVRIAGLRVDREYTLHTVYRGTRQRHEWTGVLTVEEPRYVPRRVLVLDETGEPVPGVRVQFGVRNGWGAFAVTGEEGIAHGQLSPGELYLVAVQWEPGVNSQILHRPSPDEDPIVFRGDLGKVIVYVDLVAEGLVEMHLTGGKREQKRRVHVHGRGRARFHIPVTPGDYRVEATLDGRTVEAAFAARAGEKLLVPLRFD
jgi:hypothetical protein